MLYMVNILLYKQGTPNLRSGHESAAVKLWLVPAAVTWARAVKVDLIPADVWWIADVKLDLILSRQIVALDQPAAAIISTPLNFLHHAPGRMPVLRTGYDFLLVSGE